MKEAKIYLRMDPEIAEQFHKIKRQLGLKNDTEVMRYLIMSFRNLKEKERKLDDFLEKFYDKVEKLEQDLKAFEKAIEKSF